jgi:hypothetical protein
MGGGGDGLSRRLSPVVPPAPARRGGFPTLVDQVNPVRRGAVGHDRANAVWEQERWLVTGSYNTTAVPVQANRSPGIPHQRRAPPRHYG